MIASWRFPRASMLASPIVRPHILLWERVNVFYAG